MNDNPIGVFDSGLGGLSVWREIRAQLPQESLIYFGDGLRCPYGGRPMETIREYVEHAVEWMLGRGAKLIVVACNTATAAAITSLREKYPDVPFVGMEPAVKPAALASRCGIVAVLATEASLEGELFRSTSSKYDDRVEILSTPGRGFVELVERGDQDSPQAFEAVRAVVEPLIEAGADQLVLGCTHYPLLRPVIERVIGGREVTIVDPAPAVARRVVQLLGEKGLRAAAGHIPQYDFHTLSGEDYLERIKSAARSISDADFGIWFTASSEHGVEVYGDIQGNLIRAAIE